MPADDVAILRRKEGAVALVAQGLVDIGAEDLVHARCPADLVARDVPLPTAEFGHVECLTQLLLALDDTLGVADA